MVRKYKKPRGEFCYIGRDGRRLNNDFYLAPENYKTTAIYLRIRISCDEKTGLSSQTLTGFQINRKWILVRSLSGVNSSRLSPTR